MSNFERFQNARKTLIDGINEGVAPGFVAGFWDGREPERFEIVALGERRIKWKGAPSLPMETDTLFDLASVSKVFATAPLIALLVERGWLNWETSVKTFFPEFSSRDIQIKHLLSHTSGLIWWKPFYETIRAEFSYSDAVEMVEISDRQKLMRELVLGLKPEFPVGTKCVYSDPNFLILGFIIEELTGLPLDEAVKRYLWKPMDLESPHYVRTTRPVFIARNDAYAATEDCPWRNGVLQGQVHDDNCWTMGGYGGHAGAFSNIRDLLKFGKTLCEGTVLSNPIRNKMWSLIETPAGCGRTLGWDTPTGEMPAFKGFSNHSVGHTGFTGTSFWIDLENEIVVSLLSNRVHPSRENQKIKEFRSRFHQALSNDLKKR